MTPHTQTRQRNGEAGFTLIEALMAIVVLAFGLISIANLSIVATSSNSVANRSSAATMVATQQLEVLRSTRFTLLVPTLADTLNVTTPGYSATTTVEGVGVFDTTWQIQTGANANVMFIQVRTEPRGFRARLSRAEFTTMRACTGGTNAGCPL